MSRTSAPAAIAAWSRSCGVEVGRAFACVATTAKSGLAGVDGVPTSGEFNATTACRANCRSGAYCVVGALCAIGAYCVVGTFCAIGAYCVVEAYCVVGAF
ncbi:MAG: hypothetical protein IKU86_07610 [Thermoguttaceae bacterium]|nr:hypothetical protein [Thermoguttaceae bacterium]